MKNLKPRTKEDLRLERVTIHRQKDGWSVTRERKENGESGLFTDLEGAFGFVRAIYGKDGEIKDEIGLGDE